MFVLWAWQGWSLILKDPSGYNKQFFPLFTGNWAFPWALDFCFARGQAGNHPRSAFVHREKQLGWFSLEALLLGCDMWSYVLTFGSQLILVIPSGPQNKRNPFSFFTLLILRCFLVVGWRWMKAWGGGGSCGQGRDIWTWEEDLVAGSENLSGLTQIIPFVCLFVCFG